MKGENIKKMKDKIVIVGAGSESHLTGKAIAHLIPDDVIVIDSENVKKEQLPFPKSEPFIIKNPYPLASINNKDKFVCKGKHEYRAIGSEWVCQCGKKL